MGAVFGFGEDEMWINTVGLTKSELVVRFGTVIGAIGYLTLHNLVLCESENIKVIYQVPLKNLEIKENGLT